MFQGNSLQFANFLLSQKDFDQEELENLIRILID